MRTFTVVPSTILQQATTLTKEKYHSFSFYLTKILLTLFFYTEYFSHCSVFVCCVVCLSTEQLQPFYRAEGRQTIQKIRKSGHGTKVFFCRKHGIVVILGLDIVKQMWAPPPLTISPSRPTHTSRGGNQPSLVGVHADKFFAQFELVTWYHFGQHIRRIFTC